MLLAMPVAVAAFAGCMTHGTMIQQPAALLDYQSAPTQAKLVEVARSYAEAINANIRERVAYPGLYADYGVVLCRLGYLQQANLMFNTEKAHFPDNTLYVDMLRQQLVPQYMSVKDVYTDTIDVATLDTIPVVLTEAELALKAALEADPEYQAMMKQKAREEKMAQTEAKQKEREQARKQKQAEQKAKAKEREMAKRAKEAAKERALQAKRDSILAEEYRRDSILAAEARIQRQRERAERQRAIAANNERRRQERIRQREERKARREELARRYEAWLIKYGYREAPEGYEQPADTTTTK